MRRVLVAALLLVGALAPAPAVAQAATPAGTVFAFGDAAALGSPAGAGLRQPIVGIAATPTGAGYRLASADGGVFSYGDAAFLGSAAGAGSPIVGIASTPSGRGYWLGGADGSVHAFGDAPRLGGMGGTALNRPIVGIASTPSGRGYWLVASDGGLFAFGDARFFGSTGAIALNQPIVGMAATPTGSGYWLVAADGGLFAFGDARFFGSTGSLSLNQPIVGMASTGGGRGYWLVASDGGLFAFGDARFHGSLGGAAPSDGFIVGMAATPSGGGYWLAATRVGDSVSVVQTGGLAPATLQGSLDAARAAGGRAAVYHSGTVGLLAVRRGAHVVQGLPPGWRIPMASIAVDPVAAGPLVGGPVASVLRRGEVVFGLQSARLRGARVGDTVALAGWDGRSHVRRVGLIAPSSMVGSAELVFSDADARSFGFARPSSVTLWGFRSRAAVDDAVARSVPPGQIEVNRSWLPLRPDRTLPTVRLKMALGEFAYQPGAGDGVSLSPGWVRENIGPVRLPILGTMTCNRKIAGALAGALQEVADRGLAGAIDVGDSRRNGGCYNPRLIRGGDSGGNLSRHSWGIAVDINPSQNVFGGRVRMDHRVVEIFRRWGFAWGGTWVRPDGMHFAWAPTELYRVAAARSADGMAPPAAG